MNFYALGALLCHWKGHRWSKAKDVNPWANPVDGLIEYGTHRVKRCTRCGLEREVQRRAKKAEAL